MNVAFARGGSQSRALETEPDETRIAPVGQPFCFISSRPARSRTAWMRNLSFQKGTCRLTLVIDLIAAGFYASVAAGVTRLNFERSK